MARSEQASKKKGRRKTLPLVGAAGASLAFAGGAYATAPTEPTPPQDTTPRPVMTLGEEEISDVNLGTFYLFDKENVEFGDRVQLARRGCGGCGCRGCAARGCRGCGCAAAEAARCDPSLRLWRLRLLPRLPGVDWLGLGLGLLAEHEKPAGGLPPPAAVSGAVTAGASAADHPSKPARTPAQMMTAVVSCARAPSG